MAAPVMAVTEIIHIRASFREMRPTRKNAAMPPSRRISPQPSSCGTGMACTAMKALIPQTRNTPVK